MWPCYGVHICMCMDFLFVYFVSQCTHALNPPQHGLDFFLEIFLWRLSLHTANECVDNDTYRHNCLKHDSRVCVCVVCVCVCVCVCVSVLTACTAWSSSLLSIVCVYSCQWLFFEKHGIISNKVQSAGGAIYWHKKGQIETHKQWSTESEWLLLRQLNMLVKN